MSGKRPGIIAMVPDRWGGPWMSRHQILTRLARYFPVVWIDFPPDWRAALRSRRDRDGPAEFPRDPDLHFYRAGLSAARFVRPGWLAEWARCRRVRAAASLLEAAGDRPALLYLWRPEFGAAIGHAPGLRTLYHVVDEYSFATKEQPLSAEEAALLGRADQVVIHSPGLWEKRAAHTRRAAMIPNGVDFKAYSTPVAEPSDLAAIPHPRVGYVGIIKGQLDMPLLVALAARRSNWSFVFVGPVMNLQDDEPAFRELATLPNVHLLGPKPVNALPAYVQHLDIGLMPYDDNDYTKFIYPLKLHEYLATGLSVVATPIRTLRGFGPLIRRARTADQWEMEITAELAEPASLEIVNERRRVAAEHDWESLVFRLAGLVADLFGGNWPQWVHDQRPR